MGLEFNKPKISIIVAAYNIEDYIERCLKSLINQSMKEIEIIVVNDGSTDKTLEKIKKTENYDKRLRVIDKTNEGLIEARKTGLNEATGEYILFVDGDDWLANNCCEALYNEGKEQEADIVYYNLIIAKGNQFKELKNNYFGIAEGYEYLNLVLEDKIKANIVLQFIRRDFIKENNIILPSNVSYAEDLAITVTLAVKKPKVVQLNKGLYFYYQREGSITNRVNNRIFEVEKVINYIEKILKEENLYKELVDKFNYIAFVHLYYYRIIKAKYIDTIHIELFNRWIKRQININKDNNTSYKELYEKSPLNIKVKLNLYENNFSLGRFYTTLESYFIHKPKKIIKRGIIWLRLV